MGTNSLPVSRVYRAVQPARAAVRMDRERRFNSAESGLAMQCYLRDRTLENRMAAILVAFVRALCRRLEKSTSVDPRAFDASAFDAGRTAYGVHGDCYTVDMNPYPLGTSAYGSWESGYANARLLYWQIWRDGR
jgi:hypothetical protein